MAPCRADLQVPAAPKGRAARALCAMMPTALPARRRATAIRGAWVCPMKAHPVKGRRVKAHADGTKVNYAVRRTALKVPKVPALPDETALRAAVPKREALAQWVRPWISSR